MVINPIDVLSFANGKRPTPFRYSTAEKMKFSIKDFFSKCDQNPQETADLVIFTEEILNGKPHFLHSVTGDYLITF